MSQDKSTKSPIFSEREIATLIDEVSRRLKILFPGAYANTGDSILDTDKQEAWEQIAAKVNSVEGNNFSAEEAEMMYIKVLRCI